MSHISLFSKVRPLAARYFTESITGILQAHAKLQAPVFGHFRKILFLSLENEIHMFARRVYRNILPLENPHQENIVVTDW